MEWDGGSRVQTYLSILCFDAQFSRKGSAGFRFAASQVSTSGGAWHVETPWEAMSAKHQQAHLETQQERGSRTAHLQNTIFCADWGGYWGYPTQNEMETEPRSSPFNPNIGDSRLASLHFPETLCITCASPHVAVALRRASDVLSEDTERQDECGP